MATVANPKLRSLDAQWIEQQGSPALLLQDRLAIGARAVVVPHALAPLLALCDGTRDIGAIRVSLELTTGIRLDQGTVERALAQLDKALMLDNERFREAYSSALESYRSAPYRPELMAGTGYPAEVPELRELLERHLTEAAAQRDGHSVPLADLKAIVCPHIDYDRGAASYGLVWDLAREAVARSDLFIILGTDHGGGPAELTLTRQSYHTPYGVLPTAVEAVDAVADAIGSDAAFASELNHRAEHSVELAAVWLHHLVGDRAVRIVPVLCGSFQPFTHEGRNPEEDARWRAAADALRMRAERERTLVVVAADLAHVGPAFGDPAAIGPIESGTLAVRDAEMLGAISRGNRDAFLGILAAERDSRKVCGLPPIYLALRMLGDVSGEVVGYSQCPAPNGSVVSIAGILLR